MRYKNNPAYTKGTENKQLYSELRGHKGTIFHIFNEKLKVLKNVKKYKEIIIFYFNPV